MITEEITTEPVAWIYELAHGHDEDGPCNWHIYLEQIRPNASFGAIRNLRPLYAGKVEPL